MAGGAGHHVAVVEIQIYDGHMLAAAHHSRADEIELLVMRLPAVLVDPVLDKAEHKRLVCDAQIRCVPSGSLSHGLSSYPRAAAH